MSNRASQPINVLSIKNDLDENIETLTKWLGENSLEDIAQAQADEGACERLSWHYGYLIALRDVRQLLSGL
jgi:hypothetical protein